MPLFNDDTESMVMAARSTEALSFMRLVNECRTQLEDEITAATLEYDRKCAYYRQTFSNTVISALRDSQIRTSEFSKSVE